MIVLSVVLAGTTITRVAESRRVDGASVERVIFAMVANRMSATPLSKLATCEWAAKRSYVDGLIDISDDACYRAMDFFLDTLEELQEAVFFTVANLFNLEVDLLFFDTSSTYFETDHIQDEMIEDTESDIGTGAPAKTSTHEALVESGIRAYNSASKDQRPDLPQVVLGMAVTREGIPSGSGRLPAKRATRSSSRR